MDVAYEISITSASGSDSFVSWDGPTHISKSPPRYGEEKIWFGV